MKISIIVPVYNEEKFVGKLLSVLHTTKFPCSKEIIIVNDGSKDNSRKIIQDFIKGKKGFVFIDKKNGGKGSAIIAGIKEAKGDIITIQDSDLEYPPSELSRLVRLLLSKKLDVIYGNRFEIKNRWAIKSHYFGNKVLSYVFSILFFHFVIDMETCYKVMRAKHIKGLKLKSHDFRIEVEVTAKLIKQGLKITEIPIKYYPRTFEEGKKINWRDGILALMAMIQFRFFD